MWRLQVADNDALRILLKRPQWCSRSDVFVAARVYTVQPVSRNHVYKCVCLLNGSGNVILVFLINVKTAQLNTGYHDGDIRIDDSFRSGNFIEFCVLFCVSVVFDVI